MMAETPKVAPIESSLDLYCSNLSDIIGYLVPDADRHTKWQTILEDVYNHLSQISSNDNHLKEKILLPQLLVENFDDEQIWQQIELLNNVLLSHVSNEINKKLTLKVDNVEGSNETVVEDSNESEDMESPVESEDDIDGPEEGAIEDTSSKPTFSMKDMDEFCEELEKDKDSDGDEDSDGEIEGDIFGEDAADEVDNDEEEIETRLEKQLKKVQAKIAANEDEAMSGKTWQMLGESSQRDRETNALLEEHLQFDHGVRPAPEITLDTTNKLEKLILERIKAKLFDDVERKEKPAGRDKMKPKDLPLNQEKSQLSLAEVYEKDYLAAQEQATGEEKEEVDENEENIKADLANLFRKLDALSNFSYTPKGVKEEIKIVVNAPAISMEDAIPTAVSEAQILAPSEVKAKQKEELRTSLDETQTDKKRKRRKMKKAKSIKSNERELKKLKLERDVGKKSIRSKSDAVVAVAEEVKQGISLAKKSSEKVNSNFFSKLQDSINAEGSNEKQPRKKSKTAKPKTFNKFS